MPSHGTLDDRSRQDKALKRWEEQQKIWAKTEASVARQVSKPPGETLQATTHQFRQKQEEMGVIDISVPAEIKNGVSAWEMNLRSKGTSGVRYVQIGSSFPYPLYCPIRDAEQVSAENNNMMRVIPATIPDRHKPVSQTEYYQSRMKEFKKHIKTKFAHFTDQQDSIFGVEGMPPPTIDELLTEDNDVEPVVFYPMEPKATEESEPTPVPPLSGSELTNVPREASKGSTPAHASESSRPVSAVTSSARQPPTPNGQEGPMLVFSSAHLSFSCAPGEPSQATLSVENVGSTAVFYSWVPVGGASGDGQQLPIETPTAALGGAAEPGGRDLFVLSDALNGVVVPEEEKLFTFTFQSPVAGVFSRQFELLSVPAGKERIIVQLRGVVLTTPGDAVGTLKLEAKLAAGAPKIDTRAIVNSLTSRQGDNPLIESDARLAVETQRAEKDAAGKAAEVLQEERRAAWDRENAVPLPDAKFNRDIFEKLLALHDRFHAFYNLIDEEAIVIRDAVANAAAVPAPVVTESNPKRKSSAPQERARSPTPTRNRTPTPTKQIEKDPAPLPVLMGDKPLPKPAPAKPVPTWNGSVSSLVEDLRRVRDPQVRTSFLNALSALLEAAEVVEDEKETIATLLMRRAQKTAWDEAIDGIHLYATTASDIAEGKTLVVKGATSGKDAKGKGGKADKKPGKDKDKGAEKPVLEEGARPPGFHGTFFAGCRTIVGDAVENLFGLYENSSHSVATMCDRPLDALVGQRREAIVNVHATADPVMETTLEPQGKKKR